MVLSSDELEILEYLKSWKGTYVSMVEVCRCAGGRKKFKESPNWARSLMSRLVDANLVQVNDRGHYRVPAEVKSPTLIAEPTVSDGAEVKLDNLPPEISDSPKTSRWVSPEIAAILQKAGKKIPK